MMSKKQQQTNPHIERVYEKFITDAEAHDDIPKETTERLRKLVESGKKIDLKSIDEIVNE